MKSIYLTIDDGPSIDRKDKVDLLYQNGIQAIWFSIGTDMEKRPQETLYTIKNGGIIGNHSYSHPHFSEIPLEKCCEEILKNDRIIDNFYKEAGVERKYKFFRFPYGDKGANNNFFTRDYSDEEHQKVSTIQDFLKQLGYNQPNFSNVSYKYYKALGLLDDADWFWTYDVMEWCTFQNETLFGIKELDDVVDLMDLDLPEKWAGLNYPYSDDIVVIHDHPQTSYMFGDIIKRLIEKKLIFHKMEFQ